MLIKVMKDSQIFFFLRRNFVPCGFQKYTKFTFVLFCTFIYRQKDFEVHGGFNPINLWKYDEWFSF